MITLPELVVQVHDAFNESGIPHGFGGAIALGYVVDPRGTLDVDVCVFIPIEELDRVDDAFVAIGLNRSTGAGPPIAGERYQSADHAFHVDVFPAVDARYSRIEQRLVWYPFGHELRELPFLSAEDVTVFKLSFGRTRDWLDLSEIAHTDLDLDIAYIEDQLIALRGPTMYPRLARFQAMRRCQDS